MVELVLPETHYLLEPLGFTMHSAREHCKVTLRREDRTTQAGLLQNAIWYLEGEVGNQASNPYFTMLAGVGITNPFANANGAYGVRALNLTDSSGNIAQDQLVKVNAPVPPTVWLLGVRTRRVGRFEEKI